MLTNIVVGAGQAGGCAAIAMRRAGFAGRIVLLGDEGALPYERPPLSKEFLSSTNDLGLTHFYEPAAFAAAEIEVVLGVSAEAIDLAAGRLSLSMGGTIPYDSLVLATGSRPRRLQVPGAERARVLRTFRDAVALRSALLPGARVVCIGAGVIGLEIASSARARGCHVTIVDIAATVMSRTLDPGHASAIADLHRRNGVELALENSVAEIGPENVILTNGTRLPADVVVAGIGVERNTALARDAGIVSRRGIITNASGLTTAERIYAAGEVAEFLSLRLGTHTVLETWRHAQDHGALVGRVAAGNAETYEEVLWFWSDQHGVNLQFAGDTTGLAASRVVHRGEYGSSSFASFHIDAHGTVIGAVGHNAGKDIAAALRLIRQRIVISPELLADVGVSIQRIVAEASKARPVINALQ
jgi:3-phenylpropionate/trans-cinnamate dioxygenase ferredoxin reductase subunit